MSRSIRILHIVTNMNRGGIESMLMNYYRHIDRTKIQFDFLEHRPGESDFSSEIRQLGGKIYKVGRCNPFSTRYRRELKNFFDAHPEYQIVHSHINCMSTLPLQVAKQCGVKCRITHSHIADYELNLKYPIKMYYRSKLNNVATDRFACGIDAGRYMYGKQDFVVMKNAINTDSFIFSQKLRDEKRRELCIADDELLIGHVGRFDIQKNHGFILDIFKEVIELKHNATLLLVGKGKCEEEIKKKAKALHIEDHVRFLGLRNDVNELLNAMDVFLFPSLYEGLPVTLIEAQASGLLCYISDKITDECIVTDLVKKVGLDQSAGQWAKEIVENLEYTRQNQRQQIVNGGYDIETNVQRISDFYEKKFDEINKV